VFSCGARRRSSVRSSPISGGSWSRSIRPRPKAAKIALPRQRAEIAAKLNADKAHAGDRGTLSTRFRRRSTAGAQFPPRRPAGRPKLPVITYGPLSSCANGGIASAGRVASVPAALPAPRSRPGFENRSPTTHPRFPALADKAGYVVVFGRPRLWPAGAPRRSPAIRDRIANDWIASQAIVRAQDPPRTRRDSSQGPSRGPVRWADAGQTEAGVQSAHPAIGSRRRPRKIAQGPTPEAIPGSSSRLVQHGRGARARWLRITQGPAAFLCRQKTSKITPGNPAPGDGRDQAKCATSWQQTTSDDYGAAISVTAIPRGHQGSPQTKTAIKAVKTADLPPAPT